MGVLIINAGSSSLKYQFIDMNNNIVLAKGLCDRVGLEGSIVKQSKRSGTQTLRLAPMKNHTDAIKETLKELTSGALPVIHSLGEIEAVGHRVVHGGEKFFRSVIVDDAIMEILAECSELAPIHNPPNITGILACRDILPGKPQVAVFDTAFHQSMPDYAYMYAIPYSYYEKYRIRKYGFHGTSHKYVAERAAAFLKKPITELKIISCHLGNGSSIAAVKHGKVLDTSMGFTPLDGLPMGTRCGSIDPAIVTYLMKKEALGPEQIEAMLNTRSGMLGISGVSSDFRDLHLAMDSNNERAKLALTMFCYQVKKLIGSYSAAMGGLNSIVFTAGVGENNAYVRRESTSGLEYMGVEVDDTKNFTSTDECDIGTDASKVRTLVIPTNEELAIAFETVSLLRI